MFSRVTSTLLRRSSALRTLSTPTVSSKTVSLTFIDSMGSRLTVPALHGQNLYEVATNNKIDLGPNPSVGGVVDKAHSEVRNCSERSDDLGMLQFRSSM